MQIPWRLTDKVFYGWVVVAVFLVIGITLYGIHFSFGVFFKSIEAEFNLTRTATSTILSANLLLAGFFSFFFGWALDRYEPRRVVLLMAVFTGLSLVLTSQTNALWQLFITYSLLLAMGTGPLFVVPMSAVSRWFDKKRGLALGLSSMGIGLGTMVMAPFATYLITNYNWHTAYLVIGLISWVIAIPLTRLLKRDPREIGALPDGAKIGDAGPPPETETSPPAQHPFLSIVQNRNFWVFASIWFLFAAGLFLIVTHLVPHVTDIGFSSIEAATVLSLLGFASIPGRLLMGIASDRIGRKITFMVSTLLQAVAIAWLIWAQGLWSLYIFALVYGFFYSGFGCSGAALISDTFGVKNIGAVLGLLEIGFGIGAATGPAVGGYIFDVSGNYTAAFIIAAVAMLVATLLVTMVRREVPGRKGI
ncbi:MAG: MFS transporter [Chloroflexota bacterium]